MASAKRHHRLLSALAFGLLALVVELVGRSLTHRVNIGQHVASPGDAHAGYYPILLVLVKVGIALLLARLACTGGTLPAARMPHGVELPPRSRFGLVFESRPPPLPA
jgi:hypothetical protein